MKKNSIAFIVIGVIVFVLLISGLSYAYLSVNVKNKNTYTFKSECLDIAIDNVNQNSLTINNAVPVSDIEGIESEGYKFRITNKCEASTNYKISLENINETNNENIRASLKSEGNFDYIIKTLKEGETELYTGTIEKEGTKEFELKEWVEYNATFTEVGKKKYENKIKVEVNPEIEPKESDIRITIGDNKATITTKEENLQYCIGRINKCNNYETTLQGNEINLEDEGKKIICVKGANQEICNIGGNYYGEGTEENPYQIQYIEDLVMLSNKTNNGTTYEAEYFKLTRDLDFENINDYRTRDETLKTSLTTGSGFTPIGNEINHFKGTFEGNNNKISNLHINNIIEGNRVGFFGYIENGTVKDLTISGEVKTTVAADIGGLTGRLNNSTIYNIKNEATVTSEVDASAIGGLVGSTMNNINIINCINNGDVTNGMYNGGIVGGLDSASVLFIDNCKNYGNISINKGSNSTVNGGIVGMSYINSTSIHIKNSENHGNVFNNRKNTPKSIGGLIGANYGAQTIIENCFNTGEIGNDNILNDVFYEQVVGGLIGAVESNEKYTIIRNSYNTGKILNGYINGGIVGYNVMSNLIIDKCYNTGEINSILKFNIDDAYNQTMGGLIGASNLYGNVKSYVINSYNKGNIFNGNELKSYNYAGGLQGHANYNDTYIINSYNIGKIQRTGENGIYAIYGGIIGESDAQNTKLHINNAYNLGEIICDKPLSAYFKTYSIIGSIEEQNVKYNISNTFYKSGTKPNSIESIGTPMSEEDMKSVKLVNQLNNNLKDIDISDINQELKEKGIINEGEEITLSSWYLSSEGYPTLNNN